MLEKRLIELLWVYDQMRTMRMSIEAGADYLIANGVAIPVRCKNCKNWEDGYFGYCTKLHTAMDYDGFCSNGERRTDAEN